MKLAEPPAPLAPDLLRRPIIRARFELGAGCGPTCTQLYGHDALGHEAYGRDRLLTEQASRRTGRVSTGQLEIDFDAARVTVSGSPVGVSRREYGVVAALAARLGDCLPHQEIVETVWGGAVAEIWGRDHRRNGRWHAFGVVVCRLRSRLGQAAHLIETVPGIGYRLISAPRC